MTYVIEVWLSLFQSSSLLTTFHLFECFSSFSACFVMQRRACTHTHTAACTCSHFSSLETVDRIFFNVVLSWVSWNRPFRSDFVESVCLSSCPKQEPKNKENVLPVVLIKGGRTKVRGRKSWQNGDKLLEEAILNLVFVSAWFGAFGPPLPLWNLKNRFCWRCFSIVGVHTYSVWKLQNSGIFFLLTGVFFAEIVSLDSYDSEGPQTPETDDSAEVMNAHRHNHLHIYNGYTSM